MFVLATTVFHCTVEELEEKLTWHEFVEWKYFHPEYMKAQSGDNTAFKASPENPFEDSSAEAKLFELLNGPR